MESTKVLEENKYTYEFEQIPSGQGSEKLNIMVAPETFLMHFEIVSNDFLLTIMMRIFSTLKI